MRHARPFLLLLALGLLTAMSATTQLPVQAEASPKEILQATPDKLKEGFEQTKHGFKKGTTTRKANRTKLKREAKTNNPTQHTHTPAKQ